MIYPEIRVPIPDMGGYTRRRGSVVYSYVYIGDRQTTAYGGTTHPKSKCIGRIELDQDNKLKVYQFRVLYPKLRS